MREIFQRVNGYPNRFILNIMNQVKSRQPRTSNEINGNIKKLFCYHTKEKKGSTIMKTLSEELRRTLPENIKMEMIYTAAKLGSQVNIKDLIPKRHNDSIIYHTFCPLDNCNEDYIGKSARRLTAKSLMETLFFLQ